MNTDSPTSAYPAQAFLNSLLFARETGVAGHFLSQSNRAALIDC